MATRIGRVATRLFYTICPRPCATRVDALFSVQLSPPPTFTMIISLFLRLITTRICSQIVGRTNKYLELARFLLIDETGPKGVYKQSQILGNEAAAYSLEPYITLHLLPRIDRGQATSTAGSDVDASLSRLLSI